MITPLLYIIKSANQSSKYLKLYSNLHILKYFSSKHSTTPSNIEIVDINIDKLMTEDEDLASNYNYDPEPQSITSNNSAHIAPIDIDPWTDEELQKGGTVDMEYIQNYQEEIHYPAPPEERSGYYEFEGIKIWLPKKMLTPATYRYRLDEGEEQTVPDDIRICKFENFKPSS